MTTGNKVRSGLGLVLGLLVAAGCAEKPAAEVATTAPTAADAPAHAGWWCDEHGYPEAECAMCSPKLMRAAKKKGDWCEHDRAKSQCFACDPGLMDKAKARYKAKTGEEMPAPDKNMTAGK